MPDFWEDKDTEGKDEKDLMRDFNRALLAAAPKPSTETKREVIARSYRYNGGRAHLSDALGVGPDQVEEYRAHLRAHGVLAEVRDDGRVAIESEKQFREVAKAGGLWSGRDGYGATDSDGNRVMTGREQVEAREKLKAQLRKEMRGYPSDFQL